MNEENDNVQKENVQEVEPENNEGMAKAVRILKIVNGGLEALWGIPGAWWNISSRFIMDTSSSYVCLTPCNTYFIG